MYRPTIGLEVHAELKTRTKMFCDSANESLEAQPNTNICPICLAHPGTLPTINREAVRHILRIGTAVGGTLATVSEFDRKSYFYPDIPKGYQISQYQHPLVTGGQLTGVAITRVHLEEDTARSTHVEGGAGDPERSEGQKGKSLIDFNRAGIPLMELVTEPVITSAEQAGIFARELQLLLRTLDAGEANLEKGEMRIEANVSVAKHEARSTKSETNLKLGTKVEIKNLNSFRSVEQAIAHEVERQTALLESGGEVVQETRGWDEVKQRTFHQRFKEGSADYRYFPEPDLPKLVLTDIPEFSHAALKATLPELPWERRARYLGEFTLKKDDIEFMIASAERYTFFDAAARELGSDPALVQLSANYIVSDLAGLLAKRGNESYGSLGPQSFAELMRLTARGELSSRGAKEVLAHLVESGGDAREVARERGLIQVHDEVLLAKVVDAVLAKETKAVIEYRAGKEAAREYLVGKAMKESKGAGNPELLRKLIVDKLGI